MADDTASPLDADDESSTPDESHAIDESNDGGFDDSDVDRPGDTDGSGDVDAADGSGNATDESEAGVGTTNTDTNTGTDADTDGSGAGATDGRDETAETAESAESAETADVTEVAEATEAGDDEHATSVPADVRRYDRFKKMEGATYERANGFLRERTYITAREWAIARLCTDFRTATGVEMTKIGKNLPRLVPFMTDTYSPQAVNQARASFENKVCKAGATFLYGAMTDLFTAEELDDVMYEATEVAKFLLEVEGADLTVDAELAAEDRISSVMREVHRQSAALRHDDVTCPHCGHEFEPDAEGDEGN